MATSPLTGILTPRVRSVVYAAYAVAAVGLGSVQVGYAAADAGQPVQLTVALAVLAYIGGAVGLTAASNPTPTPTGRHELPPDEMGG